MPDIDIVIRDRLDSGVSRKLQAWTRQANAANNAIQRLQNSMNSVGRMSGLATASSSMSSLSSATSSANSVLDRFFNHMRTGHQQLAQFGHNALNVTRHIRTMIGAMLLIGTGSYLVENIDTFRNMQNQLRLTTDSQEGLNAVTAELFEIAERARMPVDALVKSFRRFDTALSHLGKSQQTSLDVTETMGKMITLAGANAGEAASVLLQMSQAFNKGKLDGDEFRSVAELMPQVITGLTETLKISRGEIYKWSREGKLGAEELAAAILHMKDRVDEQMKSLPRTVGNALTNLFNEITREFGKLDMQHGITDTLVSGIDYLTNNLPEVIRLLEAFGVAVAVMVTPAAIAMLFKLLLFFGTITALIAGTAGALTYFSKEIKTSADGTVTLRDSFWSMITQIQSGVSSLQADLSKVPLSEYFSIDSSLSGWEQFLVIAKEVQSIVILTIALIEGIGEALSPGFEMFSQLKTLMDEGIVWVIDTILNKVSELAIKLAEVGASMLKGVGEGIHSGFVMPINKALSELGELIAKLHQQTNGWIGSLELANSLKEGISFGKNWEPSGKFTENLKRNMVDTDALIPTWKEVYRKMSDTTVEAFDRMENTMQEFWQRTQEGAKVNADFRIQEEQRIAEAFQTNKGALRGEDSEKAALLAHHEEVMRIQAAVKDAAKEYTLLGTAISGTSVFTEGFARKQMEMALQAKGFKTELDLTKLSMAELTGGMTAFGATAPQIEAVKQSVTGIPTALDSAATSVQEVGSSFTTMDAATQATQSSIDGVQASIDNAAMSSTAFSEDAVTSFSDLDMEAGSTADTVATTLSSAFDQAAMSAASFSQSAVAGLQEVTAAAHEAAAAMGGIGGGGGGFMGFSQGGYTGNAPVNRIAGVVHGQEYVMPADATRKYRPLLEAMRSGSISSAAAAGAAGSGSRSGTGLKVSVHNYGSSKISVQQISADEVRIIAREESQRTVQTQASEVVAQHLRNPNSKVSKSIAAHTNAQRRR